MLYCFVFPFLFFFVFFPVNTNREFVLMDGVSKNIEEFDANLSICCFMFLEKKKSTCQLYTSYNFENVCVKLILSLPF